MAAAPSTTPELLPAWWTCSISRSGYIWVISDLNVRAGVVERQSAQAGEARRQTRRAPRRGLRPRELLVVEGDRAVEVVHRDEAAVEAALGDRLGGALLATRRRVRRAPRAGCLPAWRWRRRRRPGAAAGGSSAGACCRASIRRQARPLRRVRDIISVPPAMTMSSMPGHDLPAAMLVAVMPMPQKRSSVTPLAFTS